MDEQKKNYANFDELKEACVNFVKASKGRGAYVGLKKLLTELYPDKAHFIYELLQNAEDQDATKVEFILLNDRLVFRHNGKNDFTLNDIDSITNIGNSTKIDDPTTIGKFGVGFKAVYAYTNTPEIHSGEFDFKIIDMLIPENIGVEKRAQEGVTEFVFPFDNPSKVTAVAVEEIENTLKALNETAILFLRHIKTIQFILPNQDKGEISVHSNTANIKFIEEIDIKFNDAVNKTFWAKFGCKAPVYIDGDMKRYPVSIAYKLLNDDKGKYIVDSKLIGKVCIYFPTDQRSLLHFHINAPFASTVARDNIQYCQENEQLLDSLSDLLISSIYDFKKYKMLDYSVYEALPIQRDFDAQSRYKIFYTKVYDEFETSALFIDENGDYRAKSEIFSASIDVKKVLPLKYVNQYYGKTWIPAIQPAQRIEHFFNQFNIEAYTMETFLNELRINPCFFDTLLQDNTNVDYMRHLYYMLSQIRDREQYAYYVRNISVGVNKKEILQEVKFILCKDMKLHSISEELYFETDYKPIYIKEPLYVDLGKGNKDRTELLREFLVSLGVKEMTVQLDTMSEIEDSTDSDDVVLKLLEIIDYYRENGEVDEFLESSFILGRRFDDNKLEKVKASECCWDDVVYFFYADEVNYIVAKDCYESLNTDEWQMFREIFVKLKGKVAPKIYQCDVNWQHPEYKNLNTSRERYDTRESSDYTITGLKRLENIPREGLYKEALLLWETLVKDKNIKHHIATYRPNQSAPLQEFESRVAWYLKRIKWIPDRDGVFMRPCDITAEELCDEYEQPSPASVFLNNIGFGDKSQAPDNIITNLENAGIKVSDVDKELLGATDDEKAALARFLKAQREQSKKGKSLTDALAEENKDQVAFEEDDDYGRDIGVKNPQGRAEKLQKDFEEGLERKVIAKPVLTYTFSDKTSNIEKQFVREQYKGRCQLCGREPIRKYNGDIYFEAINIISTAHLDPELLNDVSKGWNTLCLCPTCAAEYRYCSKNLDGFEKQVDTTVVKSGQSDYIPIQIILKGVSTQIRFTPKHFIALKTAFNVYRKHDKSE